MSQVIMDFDEAKESEAGVKPKRKAFATWEVEGETYRLKLSTAAVCQLEERFKTNIMNLIYDDTSIPPLSNMLYIVHAAMKDYHHGTKLDDVKALYDKYLAEGGSLVTFFIDVFMPIFQVSGFFTENVEGKMVKQMEQAKEEMM